MTDTETPLPCPFCGKDPVYQETLTGLHAVRCDEPWQICPIDVEAHWQDTRAEAVSAWNRRGGR